MSDDQLQAIINALADERTRHEAIKRLGASGDARAIPPLTKILQTVNQTHAMAYRDRQLAAEALGNIGDVAAVPMLMLALEDVSSPVKAAAARALGQIGDPKTLEALNIALKDRNADVRTEAAKAITQLVMQHDDLTPVALLPLLEDPEDDLRNLTADLLQQSGPKAYETLLQGMQQRSSTIRGAAANLLGVLKDERARDVLRRVSLEDDSRWVRTRAEWALKQLPPVEFEYPRVKRDAAPPPPKDTIELIRSQQPAQWPSLRDNKPETKPTAPASDAGAAPMTAAKIREMIDLLDMRFAKGEITEETYKQLVGRWQDRLDSLL